MGQSAEPLLARRWPPNLIWIFYTEEIDHPRIRTRERYLVSAHDGWNHLIRLLDNKVWFENAPLRLITRWLLRHDMKEETAYYLQRGKLAVDENVSHTADR